MPDRPAPREARQPDGQRPDDPVTPGATDHTEPATAQVVAPDEDGQVHSDLGQVSGGLGEEGVAREHRDG
ncbi:MAG TPA: hypothetical protein VF143_07455 [Candidatus Nanopelagicales bacterium]